MFLQLLRTQLLLKGVMSENDWKLLAPNVRFNFNQDSYFTELKETEIIKERLDILSQMEEYVGKYYSTEWIRKNILRQSEEDINIMDTQIQKETAEGGGEQSEEEGDFE